MNDDEQRELMRERFRLRAAMDGMRARQRMAGVGAMIGIIIAGGWHRIAPYAPADLRWYAWGAAILVPILFSLPFLNSKCPQCKGRYHGIGSIARNQEAPLPCKSCGFKIDQHVSRYS